MKAVSYTTIISFAIALSFCSFSYELILAKTIGILTNSTVIVQSITIGIYILFLGVGTIVCDRKKRDNPEQELFSIEILLSISGAVCVILAMLLHTGKMYVSMTDVLLMPSSADVAYYEAVENAEKLPMLVFMILVQAITAWIGFLSGYEIPLLIALATKHKHPDKDNEIIGYGALGTLVATLCFAFLFLRYLDVDKTAILVASFNLLLGGYVLFVLWKPMKKIMHIGAIAFSIAVIVGAFIISPIVYQIDLKTYYYYDMHVTKSPLKADGFTTFLNNVPEVKRTKTLYQYIDEVKKAAPDAAETDISIFLDRNFQFQVIYKDDVYHEGMAHVPVNLFEYVPKKILVLGAGDGLLIRELLNYGDKVDSITHIELDKDMLNMSNTHEIISDVNQKSLMDKKVTTLIQDAFYYVRNSKEVYDAIYIDFPYPYSYDLIRLYSKEFLTYVSRRVIPNGYIVMDIPLYDDSEVANLPPETIKNFSRNNSIFFSTIKAAGLDYGVYDVGADPFVLMFKNNDKVQDQLSRPHMFQYHRPTLKEPRQVRIENYSYEIGDEYVNSIFRPKLLNVGNEY